MYTSVYFFLILELTKCGLTYNAINNARYNANRNINSNSNVNNRPIWARFKLIREPNLTPKIMHTARLHETPPLQTSVYKVIQNKNNKTEVKFITLNPDSNLVIHSKHYNSSVNISDSGRQTNSEKRVPMGAVQLTTKFVNTTANNANTINNNKNNKEMVQQSKVGVNDLLIVSDVGRRRRRPVVRDEEEDDEDEEDDDDYYGISEVTETVEEEVEGDDDEDEEEEEEENEEILEDPVAAVTHKIPLQPQYAVIPQPVFVQQSAQPLHSATAVAVPKRTRKNKLGRGKHKIKRRLKKFMLPLLLAYKLKFLILVPLLMGALVLIVGTTGFAGFFFALFVVGLGLQKKWS